MESRSQGSAGAFAAFGGELIVAQRKAAESLELTDTLDAPAQGHRSREAERPEPERRVAERRVAERRGGDSRRSAQGAPEHGGRDEEDHGWHLRRDELEAWLASGGSSRGFLRRLLHHVTDLCPTCAAGLAGVGPGPEPARPEAAEEPRAEAAAEPGSYADVFRIALGRAREHEETRTASGNAGSSVRVYEHVREARAATGSRPEAAAEALERAWREAERLPGHAPTTIYLENQALLHCAGAQLALSNGRLAEAWRAMRTAQILAGGVLDPIIRAELRITHGLLFWAEGEPVLAFQRLASAWSRLTAVGQIDRSQPVLAALAWIDEHADLGQRVSPGRALAADLARHREAAGEEASDVVAVLEAWERSAGAAASADAVH